MDTHHLPSLQPPSVDFIDNRLPRYHPVFVDPPARYDAMSGQYVVANVQTVVPRPVNASTTPHGPSTFDTRAPRPALKDPQTYRFWNDIFPEAMHSFQCKSEAPRGVSGTAYNIRGQRDWKAVYEILQAARDQYKQEGLFRRTRRKMADHVGPAVEAVDVASTVVPDSVYSTPILGSLAVLLNAVKTAAGVRNEVLGSLDSLIPTFSTAELFLGVFQEDVNIREAARQLTVSTLVAIEQAIAFFLRHEIRKAGKAILQGADYEKKLLESLQAIGRRSAVLADEAQKSHIYQSHLDSIEARRTQRSLLDGQQRSADTLNSIHRLLVDHVQQKSQLRAAEQEILMLRAENVRLRSTSPFEPGGWIPSPAQTTPSTTVYLSQAALRQVLDIAEGSATDTEFVNDRKEMLPWRQRAHAEQVVNTQQFQDWIVSPYSAKLLVHWDFQLPECIAGISPLSVLCTTLSQALGAQERFLSAVFFCGRHVETAREQEALDEDSDGSRSSSSSSSRSSSGGRSLLNSLILQLLDQQAFDTRSLSQQVAMSVVQQGQLDELIHLLVCMVRQVPETTTLFCIVDGVAFFERTEFQDESLRVLSALLALVHDQAVSATVKVLFTSSPGTEIVRAAFEPEDLLLDVSGLPGGGELGEERLLRALRGA
ncbi:hypothetical protein ASPZODRAFT_137067 [Penicilliopsis zonata CBS 506.65]|uniref:Uncharacterized protein n=1 Tax=Penicilliopsis zonata CBS 506.65 TaxID=1073090 RepID=A0A1L9S694_9EURO|nr:hypothetical protein ASPZODRAFT_137067 [Penicilliopsis zonata CBS 506.65]OJJ42681.1 hypothetical protein ASPZODRAFT_137067 [Penicilliopsis zonata CBS 506.65]